MNMLDKLARLEGEVHRYNRALGAIALAILEQRGYAHDGAVLDSIVALLEDAGYDMGCVPSEPEDLIHGDTDAGAEG